MMNILLTLTIIAIISNIIVYDIPLKIERYISKIKLVDICLSTIYKVFTCVNCLSYHLTWLYFLILQCDVMGFLYGFITYLLASVVDRILHTTSL